MDASQYSGDQKWLKAAHLQGAHKVARITDVTVETFKDGKKSLTLHFHGTDKMLGLNATNNNTMMALYGTDTDGWIGKSVTVFPTTTDYQGKRVPCVRIEDTPPKRNSQPPQEKGYQVSTGHAKPRQEAPPDEGFDDDIPGWDAGPDTR